MDKEYILQKLRENKEYFSKYGVVKIGLFGSYLSGEVTEESDIDILIKMKETENNYFNYCYVLYFLEDLFNKKIYIIKRNIFKHTDKRNLKLKMIGYQI